MLSFFHSYFLLMSLHFLYQEHKKILLKCYKFKVYSTHAQQKMYPAHGHVQYSVIKSKSNSTIQQNKKEESDVKFKLTNFYLLVFSHWNDDYCKNMSCKYSAFLLNLPFLNYLQIKKLKKKAMHTLVNRAEKHLGTLNGWTLGGGGGYFLVVG